MAAKKKLSIEIPACLLEEIEKYCDKNDKNKDIFLIKAVKYYLKEMKREEIRNHLRDGYKKMAGLNQQLADEGLSSECYSYLCYEQRLVECEKIESKKG